MNLAAVADVIAWSALMPALTAAAVLSILAQLKPRAVFLWSATGALGIALMSAATISEPSGLALAPLVTILGFTVAVFGGSPAATLALNVAMGGSVAPGIHGGIIVTERPSAAEQRQGVVAGPRREVLRGGFTIGVLERIGAAGTIIAGLPEGLAIVVAVKGVGRFTELESPEARERFIIGTFASLIWASAAALVVHLALR